MGRKNLTFKQLERRRRLLRWAGIPESTLRDWLPILIALLIPLFIFYGTTQITQEQANSEAKRAHAERELAEQRAQDEALQTYLDQMGSLLLEKDLRESKEDSEVRTLARARTITVLERLDPSRKSAVTQFLVEAELVQRVEGSGPIIRLRDANLSGVRLSRLNLGGVYLRMVNLRYANLEGAELPEANLRNADLRKADLSRATLVNTNLKGADLSGATLVNANLSLGYHSGGLDYLLGSTDLSDANLSDANLRGVNLSGADLRGAELSEAYLRNADLSHAKGWTEVQLRAAHSLEGATMPDGQTLRGDNTPDGPTFEDWLKSQGRKEDGENE